MTNVKLMVSGKTGPAVSHDFGDTFDTTQEFSRVLFNDVPDDTTVGELMAEVGVSGSSIIAGTSATTRDATIGSLADGALLKISISGSAKADGNSDDDEESEQEPPVNGGFLNPSNIKEQLSLYFSNYIRVAGDKNYTDLLNFFTANLNSIENNESGIEDQYTVHTKKEEERTVVARGLPTVYDMIQAVNGGRGAVKEVYVNGKLASFRTTVTKDDKIQIIYQ